MPSGKLSVRKNRMRTGQSYIENRSLNILEQSGVVTDASRSEVATSQPREGNSYSVKNPALNIENENPEKVHLRFPRRIGKLLRLFSRWKRFWKPEPTPAELEQLEIARKNEQIRRVMNYHMRVADKLCVQTFFNIGIQYTHTNKSKLEKQKIQLVRFGKWAYSADGNTIYGHVVSVPYNHYSTELVKKEALTELSLSLGHPVTGHLDDKGGGVIISVSLSGTMDIPDQFNFRTALSLISQDAPPLTMFVGVGENGIRHTYDLETLPHLVIGGATGSGKSVQMQNIFGTFISRNKPETVRLLLADLKLMELIHFEGVPHLITDIQGIPTGIVTRDEQVLPMLEWLERENNRRQELFAAGRVHNLAEWNRSHKTRRLPRIVVGIDEMARVMRKSTRDKFVEVTYDLASTSRATGIYMVVSTQYATSQFITTDIKLNFSGRMAFSVPDLHGSVALIETGDAVGLCPPAGRGIFVHGVNRFKFQAPLISTHQIAEIVRNAREGKTLANLAVGEYVNANDIIKWALTENNALMQDREAFVEFQARIERDELRKILAEMDNQTYTFQDATYKVIPPAGTRGRRLELVKPEGDTEVK